jgi:DNA polymerase-3 subunit alpha
MGKKKPEEMAKQRAGFIEGAVGNGIAEDTAAYIFDLVEKFAGYGFNKSHSAAYALVSYQTAWLKAHYPADFMAAVLSADMDHTDKVVIMIDECRRLAIAVAPPEINASEYDFSVVDDTTIRYGLGAIKGLGRGAIEAVVSERDASGAFVNLYDLCRRVDTSRLNRRAIEALINAGALDKLGLNRASLMHGVTDALAAADQDRAATSAGQNDMFGLAGAEEATGGAGPPLAELDNWPEDERLKAERDTLGLYLTGHPIKAWETELARMTNGKIAAQVAAMPRPEEGGEARANPRKSAVVAGLVVEVRRMRKGKRIIVVIDDGSARIECPLFEEKAAEFGRLLTVDKLIIVEGRLSYDDFSDDFRLNASTVMDIETARAAYASRILLQLRSEAALDIDALAGCLDHYRADTGCDVVLRYSNAEARAVLTLSDMRLHLCEGLLADLHKLVGADQVQVRYRHNQMAAS